MKKLLLTLLFLPLFSISQVQIGQDINGFTDEGICGTSVSLSSDGSVVAVGEPFYDPTTYEGRTRIFRNIAGTWTQIGNALHGEGFDDSSGRSVSLSADGSIIAIGAPDNSNSNGDFSGHVRIFENIGGTWTRIGQDIDADAEDDKFGASVSLSSDGSTVAIGASRNDSNGSNSGQVRIYENIGETWIQIGSDILGENAGDTTFVVSLSSDGSILAVGSPGSDLNGSNSGLVRIYENIGETWIQIGNDILGENTGDELGAVSLSSDGSIVAVGASNNDGNGSNSGHVRVFRNISDTWIQIGQNINGEAEEDRSGSSISLSSDGSVIAIGAFFNDGNGSNSGHVRIYKNIGDIWTLAGPDINGEAEGDQSGLNVSLSSDGSIVAIGAPRNDDSGNNSGHARVYDISAFLSLEESTQLNFELFPNPAKNQFTIQLQNGQELKQVNIYNNLSQLIKTAKKKVVKTTTLATGIYYVEVITTSGKNTKKLIIE